MNEAVSSILPDSHGGLLLGAFTGGLRHLVFEEGIPRITHYYDKGFDFFDLTVDKDGKVWVARETKEISQVDFTGDEPVYSSSLSFAPGQLPGPLKISTTSDDMVWVGSHAGPAWFDPEDPTTLHEYQGPSSGHAVNTLYSPPATYPDGSLWGWLHRWSGAYYNSRLGSVHPL